MKVFRPFKKDITRSFHSQKMVNKVKVEIFILHRRIVQYWTTFILNFCKDFCTSAFFKRVKSKIMIEISKRERNQILQQAGRGGKD